MSEAAAGPMDEIKQRMRATWMAGDFGLIAKVFGGDAGDRFASTWR